MVDTNLQTIGLAAVVLVATLFIFLYMIFRLRRRRAELAHEPILTRAQLEDRAFNQIHIARSAAERLERSGVDVEKVTDLLDKADAARTRGDPDTATAFARSAQETLVHLRSSAPTRVPQVGSGPAAVSDPGRAGPSPASSDAEGGAADGPLGTSAPPTPTQSARERLPKNKAESRFQLGLLDEEVRSAERSAPNAAETKEGRKHLDDGQVAYERGDYTEALRLGLRGRRRVGGRLETLAPSRSTVAEPSDDEETPAPASSSTEGPSSCANCGAPLKASDGFCRACGAPRSSARCSQCGEALAASDRFCGACGAPIRG